MKQTFKKTTLALVAASSGMAAAMYVRAGAQVMTPRPEELRFQALLSEPIAAPDRRGVVAGTSALLVKDRLTGQCFIAVTIGDGVGNQSCAVRAIDQSLTRVSPRRWPACRLDADVFEVRAAHTIRRLCAGDQDDSSISRSATLSGIVTGA